MAKRFLIGGFGVVLLSAAGTVVIALNEIGKLVDALGHNKAVEIAPNVLAPTTRGAPETLLLVGNDERPPPKDNPFGSVLPHSNEMLLVRLDPSKPTISMLSIPRELQVTFTAPDGELITNRINSAYTYGGVELMLKTIKHLLGITVNHVFVTNFPKFRHAVDEIGCVYMTVDKRYHHVNEPGGEQYLEINLQPGYQRLCGQEALEFVANRHESTSIVRDARDQRFLLAVKAQYGPTLFENRERFERILGNAIETDLHGQEGVLQLLELLVESAGKPVRQVPFQVELRSSYDTATPQQVEASVHSFLTGTTAIQKHKLNKAMRPVHGRHPAASSTVFLSPTPSSTLEEAQAMAPRLPFALEVPQYQQTTAEAPSDNLRLYRIQGSGGHRYPAYVIVVGRGELGQYYDVQGTAWTDPPVLSDPSQEIRIGSRTYSVFYDGEHIKTIAWQEGNAAYWIENTLTYNLSPQAMVAVARDTRPVGSPTAPARAASTSPQDLTLLPRGPTATSLTSELAAALGFVGLAAVALLALLLLTRRRELILLREQVAHSMAVEARQRTLLTSADDQCPAAPSQ